MPQYMILTPSKIACWYSHVTAIRQFVDAKDARSDDVAVILEDDIDMEGAEAELALENEVAPVESGDIPAERWVYFPSPPFPLRPSSALFPPLPLPTPPPFRSPPSCYPSPPPPLPPSDVFQTRADFQ